MLLQVNCPHWAFGGSYVRHVIYWLASMQAQKIDRCLVPSRVLVGLVLLGGLLRRINRSKGCRFLQVQVFWLELLLTKLLEPRLVGWPLQLV